jgi:hypothetical protein
VPKSRVVVSPPLPPLSERLTRLGWTYGWTLASWLMPMLMPMLLTALALFGLIRLGQAARADLATHQHQSISFASIQCEPPPGMDREDFLGEVQYLAGWPDRVDLIDNDTSRLAEAFARHPWVEQVESISLERDHSVQVRLRFRKPVLAVYANGQIRAVDAQGILLPAAAPTTGLHMYEGVAASPKGPAGTPWGDPYLTLAANHKAAR